MDLINSNLQHSTLRPSDTKSYIGKDCKIYYLPLFKNSFFSSSIQSLLGARCFQNKSEIEIVSSIEKAKVSGFSQIKIPLDRICDKTIERTFELCRQSEVAIILQVCSSFLRESSFVQYLEKLNEQIGIEWVFDSFDQKIESQIKELNRNHIQDHISLPVTSSFNWKPLLGSALFKRNQIFHLYFGYAKDDEDLFLNTFEVNRVLKLLRDKFTEKVFLPPKGVDLWDARVLESFDMEPLLYPCFQTQSKEPNIKYSIIIPSYNNQNHLRSVLKHLEKQSVGHNVFEVIVVDDGSTDQTQALVIELIQTFSEVMNFKYIYFPRERKRTMGDSQYRAGISRNLGVKNSTGEILCFLDSDILVQKDYLNKVKVALEKYDVIQSKRINLSKKSSVLNIDYAEVTLERDTISTEKYWEDFIRTQDWQSLAYNWKYVCTHSLSLRRATFMDVGGIKRNYIYYGFEDTDLGYRLVKSGYRLHLLDEIVFHLFHENDRSEFMNLKSLRHTLLSRTAQIFYLHHFDEDIFTNLINYMRPEPSFKKIGKKLLSILTFQFIWKPKKIVFKTLTRI